MDDRRSYESGAKIAFAYSYPGFEINPSETVEMVCSITMQDYVPRLLLMRDWDDTVYADSVEIEVYIEDDSSDLFYIELIMDDRLPDYPGACLGKEIFSFWVGLPEPGRHTFSLRGVNPDRLITDWLNFTIFCEFGVTSEPSTARPWLPPATAEPVATAESSSLALTVSVPGRLSTFDLNIWDNGRRIATTAKDEGWRISLESVGQFGFQPLTYQEITLTTAVEQVNPTTVRL
jgi:hypothetical protein